MLLSPQAEAIRSGMSCIIPVPLLSLLTAKSLEQLVCGMETIDVDILKKVVRSVAMIITTFYEPQC